MEKIKEKVMRVIFFISALISLLALVLICYFIFSNGLPAIFEIGLENFLFGTKWAPNDVPASFGIAPMIVGSGLTSLIAGLIGIPIGILTAVFMTYFCPKQLYTYLKAGVDLLAGIPSVVYGLFGLVVIVPLVRTIFGGSGISILSGAIILSVMILPTIISISESSLRAINPYFYENALALGASKEVSIFTVCIPAAKSGIFSSVVLGMGRAIGETMAVIMIVGNQARLTTNILKGIRTLTANIVLEMGYATDFHRQALIGTAVVLFALILMINLGFSYLKRKI